MIEKLISSMSYKWELSYRLIVGAIAFNIPEGL